MLSWESLIPHQDIPWQLPVQLFPTFWLLPSPQTPQGQLGVSSPAPQNLSHPFQGLGSSSRKDPLRRAGDAT